MATLSLPQSLQTKLASVNLRTGLVLGFQVEQRFFALSLAFTPHTALPAAPSSLETLLASPLADDQETNYSDWVIEHARQAQRLLPAGISVLGIFACSPDEVLHDFKSKPPLLRSLLSLAEDVNKEILHRDSVLMLHFVAERQKWAGRAVDSKDSRVNVVEVKSAAGVRLEEIRGIYKMEAHFSEADMTVREGVEKIVTNVASKLNIDRILISHKQDGPLPSLKSESDHHFLEILSSSISSHLSHTRPPKAQISVSGAIETRSYVPAKTSIPLAGEVVRSDIVNSLRYRLSLYCEGEGESYFSRRPNDAKSGLYSLPCRIFYPTDAGVAVCDYVIEGESKDQSKQRVTDLTGFVAIGDGESAEQLRKTVRLDTEPASEILNPVPQAGNQRDTVKSTPLWIYAAAALMLAPHRDEFCPADSDFPDLPVEHIDVLISSIGFVFAVAVQLLSTHDKATLVGGTCRVVSEHFRYLLIVYVAYERRLSGAIRVAFDLMFPVHNLSLALYPRLTYPILMFLGFPSNFVSGCAAVFAWSTLLYVVAAACLLARQREDAFKRVSVFNILAVPDVQLAVSAGFAHWGRTTSYVQGTCCFAVSWYWSFFSILIPLIFLTNNPGLDRTAHIYEYDFRGGMKYWLIAVKTMQVVLIYGIHFLKIYFRALPGYAFVVLLLLVFMYRQLQTTYWPYKLRSLNFIADDTYLSLILMSAWARYRLDYIAAVAFCLPLRQAWRLFEFRFKRSHRSTPVLQAEEQKDNQPLGRRRKRRSKF